MRLLLIVIGALGAFFAAPWWMPRRWYRAMLYPGRRPNALSRRLNALSAYLSAIGVGPSFLVTLETRGRRTGKVSRLPMVIAQVGAERYLVSMLGENSEWVRNARASGGKVVLRHRTSEAVRLEEVPLDERAPILKAYVRRAPGGRPHFDLGADAPIEEFARVAARYPVFRIVAIADAE